MSATAKSCLRWRQLSPKAAMNGGERYDQSTIEGQLTVSSKQTDCAAAVRDLADLERAVTSQPPAAVATGASPAQMRAATVASPPPARATMGSGAPQDSRQRRDRLGNSCSPERSRRASCLSCTELIGVLATPGLLFSCSGSEGREKRPVSHANFSRPRRPPAAGRSSWPSAAPLP
jgi:hypothetical protein